MWTKKHCDNHNIDWKPLFQESFVGLIHYFKIPAHILKNEIVPLKVVPDDIIITALAYQVSTISLEELFFSWAKPSFLQSRCIMLAFSLPPIVSALYAHALCPCVFPQKAFFI